MLSCQKNTVPQNPPCSSWCSPYTGLLPTPQIKGKNSIKKLVKYGKIPPLVAMNRLDQPWFSWLVWGIAGIAQVLANTYWTIDALYLKYYTHCSYTSDVWKKTMNQPLPWSSMSFGDVVLKYFQDLSIVYNKYIYIYIYIYILVII